MAFSSQGISQFAQVSSTPASARTSFRPKSSHRLPAPLYKATVNVLANQSALRERCGTDVDTTITTRIKKCLDRARHPTTPEAEAKAALHVASRLMSQHNVSQAEIFASENMESHQRYAGQSTVALRRSDCNGLKRVRKQAFVDDIAAAMCEYFDCKTYSTANLSSLEFTFYGIADNTVAATMAFEMAYNLIAEWARIKKGAGQRNSYCKGAAVELRRRARNEKRKEEVLARNPYEGCSTQKDQNRDAATCAPRPLNHSEAGSSAPADSSLPAEDNLDHSMSPGLHDDENKVGLNGRPDFNACNEDESQPLEDIDRAISGLLEQTKDSLKAPSTAIPATSSPKYPDSATITAPDQRRDDRASPEPQSAWSSHLQLALFRSTANNIADEYIRSQDIRLHKRTARPSWIRDRDAYKEGRMDGKKIDIHRKRIEGTASSL